MAIKWWRDRSGEKADAAAAPAAASAPPDGPGPPASGGGGRPQGDPAAAASTGDGAGAARRRGPLPSLAELGAFEAPAPARPRLSGRLTDEDLRSTPAPPAPRTPAPAPPQVPSATGLRVTWDDLEAAVQAGWMGEEAARALWARWLARKPLSRGDLLHLLAAVQRSPTGPQTGEPSAAPVAASPKAASTQPPAYRPQAASAPTPAAVAIPEPGRDSGPRPVPEQDIPNAAPEAPRAAAPSPRAEIPASEAATARSPSAQSSSRPTPSAPPEPPLQAAPQQSPQQSSGPTPHPTPPSPAPPAAEPAPQAPAASPSEPEVLEPLEQADARRKADRQAQRPVIEVVDVIEVERLEKAPPTHPRTSAASIALGRVLLALAGAAAAAVCVAAGSTLFGPWGAAAAAAAWALVAWRRAASHHAASRMGGALAAAHLLLVLVAVTVWQVQEAMGWWPVAKPLDPYANPALAPQVGGAAAAAAAVAWSLDWRWLSLSAFPLLAALVWTLRLRHPLMLASVTALLWAVAFQAVLGVLQSMQLAFHGVTVFMLLLGSLTLAAAVFIDLRTLQAGASDFALWPYLFGALLLGAGWLGLAGGPPAMQAIRYLGWSLFLLWAISLQRPVLLLVAGALAGFEGAWHLARAQASDALGIAAWLASLLITGVLVMWLTPRLPRWSRPLRRWMPRAWRSSFDHRLEQRPQAKPDTTRPEQASGPGQG